jgi:antitoxin (DNA-binding transcriptional repressor) of toxin-antitoxin stability system
MLKVVEIGELSARLQEVLRSIDAGEEVVLTEANVPRARLVAVPASGKERVPELHPGAMQMLPGFDDPLPDEFWLGVP